MKKLMGVVYSFFVMVLPVQGSQQQVLKNLDGQCATGYCPCAGCDQCAPVPPPGQPPSCQPPCLQACTTVSPTDPIYSIVAQGVVYYCLNNLTINSVTNVPSPYTNQDWYTCGPSIPYPSPPTPPTTLTTNYVAYSISPGVIFSCPQGEAPTLPYGAPANSGWFTCTKKLDTTPHKEKP